MSIVEPIHRDLTKWPLLLVEGDPVTLEQANEIILRTTEWHYISGNDPSWERQVRAVLNIPSDDIPCGLDTDARMAVWKEHREAVDTLRERLGGIDLEYLSNSRIASSWIGGPHGWCDWYGHIGCGNYNIGKWPDVETVHDEWQRIAAAFPYLRLRAQLRPDEGEREPVVEWNLRDGEATLGNPGPTITDRPLDMSKAVHDIMFSQGRERRVSIERLRQAAAQLGVLA